jgi:hypothetical protein
VHERETCQGCGTRAEEWADGLDAYKAENSLCRGCRALEIGNEALKGAPAGTRVVLKRKGGPDVGRDS